MKYSSQQKSPLHNRLVLSALMAAVLAGCGGGGGGEVVADASGAGALDAAILAANPNASGPLSAPGQLKKNEPAPAPAPEPAPAPAPAPEPAPAPAPAPAPEGVSLTDYGGVCDGRTDNNAAISRGIADTKAKGVALLIPAGQCNFSSVIQLDSGKIVGAGPTSVLYATNWQQASIFMRGNAPAVRSVKLTGAPAPSRQANWEMTKLMIWGATNFVIDGVTIENSPAASIQTAARASNGLITNNTIRNSLSDSIHLTAGASYITVENNVIDGSGDDGIAVVSYQGDGTPVSNITARNNVVRGNKWGRNMSVLGGRNILYENNLLQNNPQWACLYFAQETPWNTYNVVGVTAQRNTMQNCGNLNNGHGAVLIYSDGSYNNGAPNDDIKVLSNDIIQDGRNGFNWWGPQTNVRLENNRYSGTGPAYTGNGPGVTVVQYTSGPVGYVAP